MKKKEYTKPEMQVVNITSCALLAASTIQQGKGDTGRPELEEDWYYVTVMITPNGKIQGGLYATMNRWRIDP